jgi:hypothetical protein
MIEHDRKRGLMKTQCRGNAARQDYNLSASLTLPAETVDAAPSNSKQNAQLAYLEEQ